MPRKLSQDTALLRMGSPLGPDVLIPIKFEGNERLSDNFEWKISCLLNADEDPVDPEKIVGKGCHCEVHHGEDVAIYHGLCTSIEFLGFRYEYALYEVVLRPWTWLLTQETSCEIFHEQKPEDIISKIFNDRSLTDFRFDNSKSLDPVAYCVQYQETAYDFVSRIMQKFGLFFFFEFEKDKHTLVITDDITSLADIDSAETTIKFQQNPGSGLRDHRIFAWGSSYRLRTAQIDVDDYNYEKPNTALEKTGDAKDSPGHSYNKQTQYVYPSGHLEPGLGQSLADIRVDAQRADAERKFAIGNVPCVRAGYLFDLDEHPRKEENKKYAAVAVRHEAFVATYLSGTSSGGMLDQNLQISETFIHPHLGDSYKEVHGYYVGEYEVVDKTKAYKTPLTTVPPRVHGAQTAEVIRQKNSPQDEEIDVDDQGRILVRFHWNPKNAKSDECSCRVRVAQLWAGAGWGGVWIPRVGMEVVVEFLNGDPDCPLVTGCVYNGNNEPPINFPDDKTQSTIKSQSSKGGTASANFNEIRFEDKKDDEEIYMHAERDRKMIIEHDDDIEIGNDQTEKIGGSRDFELTGGDETIVLKGAPGTKDKYGKTITKNGHRKTTLEKGDETLSIDEGKRTTTIKMDDKKTITDGDEVTTIDKGDQTTTVKMGDQTTKISMGKGTTTAMKSFEIKVGASSIKLEPAKITIKSVQVDIKGSATLKTNGGAMAEHSAGGIMKISGALIKIN